MDVTRGRFLPWACAVAMVIVAAPGAPAWAEEMVETTSTAEPGTNGDEDGYWVTVKETVFDWETQTYIEVVAYYRAYRGGWLDELRTQRFGKANTWNHTAAKNEDQVKAAVEKASWKTCLDYCEKKIPYAWQNQGVMLINPETGEILGHIKVGNSYEANNKTMNMYDREVEMDFGKGKGKEKIKIVACSVWASPIVLDLDGLGKPDLLAGPTWKLVPGRLVAMNALRSFNLDGRGLHSWEWVGPKSGLLAWDADGKGTIRSGEQLFGNYTWGKRWPDGYAALATLDNNQDGTLTPNEFTNLVVWVDANSDGVSQKGEVKSLTDLGIESLNVRPVRDGAGNANVPNGFVRNVGGARKTLQTWDWISGGYAKASEGVYVWVGQDGDKKLGGYLRLHEQAGEIGGYSVPTIGTPPLPNGLLPAFPITGKRVGDKIVWKLPAEDGTVLSEVTWEPGGKHLYGKTRGETKGDSGEYFWQAELVSGEPIGTAPAPLADGN